ncbi:MAG: ABC transporter permease [Desulfobacterota bacterium]|jgi:ABC-2 type transport system permease protein|nr:ABC transporter permease [Thermodesulfobacteriota bacterium]
MRVRELVRKEFIVLFRDEKNRKILFVAPIIQLLIFGYVVNYDIRDIRVAVLDQSRTADSRRLAEAFEASPTFRITQHPEGPRAMDEMLLRGKTDIGIKIPPDFSSRIRSGQTAEVQVLADGTQSNMASVRIGYTMQVMDGFNRGLIREIAGRDMEYGRIDARIRAWYNPNIYSQYFFVPAIVAFLVMLISLLLTSIAVIREREQGTMEQLIVTPLKPIEMILGKTIPYIIISLVQMVGITVIAKLWFSLPMAGSALLLLLATCIFLLSTLGIGLFISTVSATQQQAMMTTFFVLLPSFMLSGFIFPIANMPGAVQLLTYLNPLRFFLEILRGIFLKGVGMHILWPQFGALAILGVVFFAGAVVRFHKRLD